MVSELKPNHPLTLNGVTQIQLWEPALQNPRLGEQGNV